MQKWIGFEKGINFGGWFAQCVNTDEHYDTYITEQDFRTVKDWGVDHIRLPIDYYMIQSEEGSVIEQGYERLQKVIELCIKYNLNLIIDLHRINGFSFFYGYGETGFFEQKELQDRFIAIWTTMAERFGKYHGRVAFELLNEITDQSFSLIWNKIARITIAKIRQYAPETDIVVGSYWNNSYLSLEDLDIKSDDHIVYTFHTYDPLIFTHQGASWIDEMPQDFRYSIVGKTYKEINNDFEKTFPDWFQNHIFVPSSSDSPVFGKDYFKSLFREAVTVAEERGVKLYCGEYGVITFCDPESTLFYYKAIHECFEDLNIGRSAWLYKDNHFDILHHPLRDELIKYL